MTRRDAMETTLLALAAAVLSGADGEMAAAGQPANGGRSKAAVLLRKPLVGEGKEATLVAVDYPPGAASVKHRHPGPVFGYVVEGAVVFQIDNGPLLTYRKGETFYEEPGHVHAVSRNASDTAPAKIIAFMVADKGAALATPVQ
jgi:quercetin dioxygenase-like cupin family protein